MHSSRSNGFPLPLLLVALAGCNSLNADMDSFRVSSDEGGELAAEPLAAFDQPWAMTFLPDGRLLVTEKPGRLLLVAADGSTLAEVGGLPSISASGQGGLGDVILHPDFADNQRVYVSYVERDGSLRRSRGCDGDAGVERRCGTRGPVQMATPRGDADSAAAGW